MCAPRFCPIRFRDNIHGRFWKPVSLPSNKLNRSFFSFLNHRHVYAYVYEARDFLMGREQFFFFLFLGISLFFCRNYYSSWLKEKVASRECGDRDWRYRHMYVNSRKEISKLIRIRHVSSMDLRPLLILISKLWLFDDTFPAPPKNVGLSILSLFINYIYKEKNSTFQRSIPLYIIVHNFES